MSPCLSMLVTVGTEPTTSCSTTELHPQPSLILNIFFRLSILHLWLLGGKDQKSTVLFLHLEKNGCWDGFLVSNVFYYSSGLCSVGADGSAWIHHGHVG